MHPVGARRAARRLAGRGLRSVLDVDGGAARRIPFGVGRGLRLEIDPTSPLDMHLGLYEFEIAAHLRTFCAPGHRCFDIGGFDGYYGLAMSRLTGAEVIVFESDPAACERIERNCAANPEPGRRVQVRNVYVAFESDPEQNCAALDDLLERGELFVPDVVKIDVDRAELSVLSGARRMLSERRPHLIVETHSLELERDCAELMKECGYRPTVVTPRRWLAENRPLDHNRWLVARGEEGRRS